MKSYLLKLYQYNNWANERVIHCLKTQQVSNEHILTLMSHTFSALYIWLGRIQQKSVTDYPLWKTYTLNELEKMREEIGRQWIEFIQTTDTFDRDLSYTNYVGLPYKNKIENIMIHLVNHSTYHRAQIALLLRQNKYEPTNTDFITYDRVITGQLKN